MNNETDNDDDEALFREAMGGVTPLKPDNRTARESAPKKKLKRPPVQHDSLDLPDRFGEAMFEEECPDYLSFERAGGAQKSVLKKLRTGKMPIDDVLDLHGLTIDEASRELAAFLDDCQQLGHRCIIIVHGKGFRSQNKPVIKPMVNHWLRQAHEVLAFYSALPRDGGTGAVYVLLRKGAAE
jgi:DNA-nicking Smr family endonuclease